MRSRPSAAGWFDVHEVGHAVRLAPDRLRLGRARLTPDLRDRLRPPALRRSLDRLEHPQVGQALLTGRFRFTPFPDAAREAGQLRCDLVALRKRLALRAASGDVGLEGEAARVVVGGIE